MFIDFSVRTSRRSGSAIFLSEAGETSLQRSILGREYSFVGCLLSKHDGFIKDLEVAWSVLQININQQ